MIQRMVKVMSKEKYRSKILILLVAAQILFLMGITTSYYAVGWVGKEVRIQTEPVDPRDLLYGDYVILNYDISQLNTNLWSEDGEIPKEGTSIYVVLQPITTEEKSIYNAIGVYGTKPQIQNNQAVLKGRLDYSYDDIMNINYGLEKYYVPENTGKELEDQVGQVVVVVKIAPWGKAVIQSLEMPK